MDLVHGDIVVIFGRDGKEEGGKGDTTHYASSPTVGLKQKKACTKKVQASIAGVGLEPTASGL